MENSIVIYYSRTGNNKYIAEKIAGNLHCDIEALRPRLNIFPLLLFNISAGNRSIKHNLQQYDRVILCGPVWMGKLISPLQNFITRHGNNIAQLYFITCCGGSPQKPADQSGYLKVFETVRNLLGNKCSGCEALPVSFIVPDAKTNQEVMKARLNDASFTGEIKSRYDNFIQKICGLEM